MRLIGDQGVDGANAVEIGGTSLSRGDLWGAATAVAERVGGVQRVAVWARPTVSTVLAVTGSVIAGVTVVPVPPDAGPAEISYLLEDSQAKAWVGDAPENTSLPIIPVRIHARSWHTYPEPDPSSPAFILYTSGTTGRPKGVVLSRRAIAAGLDALFSAWEWHAADVLVHGLPLFHVHGLILGLLGPLRVGCRVIHTGKPTPEGYAAARGTMYFGVPTVWHRIVENPTAARELSSARVLVSGSAPLPVPVFERLSQLTGIAPLERYGMSETLITLSTRAAGERRPGWVGTPVTGVRTRLRGESHEPIAQDGESLGSLQVQGPMLFDGYLNRPAATAESWTADGWFRTGDVAVIDPAGFHRIVGRESVDVIKSGGYRIGAGEIESALANHPAVTESAVVGIPDADLGQRLVAYVVTSENISQKALLAHLAEQVATHKLPREIRFLPELPRNALGKVQKKLLSEKN